MGDKYSSIVISIVPPLRTSRYSFNRILNPISRLKFAKGSEESPLSDPRRILKARQGGEEAVRVARLINGRVVHDRLHARNEAFFSEWKGRQNAGKASFARQRRSKRVKRLALVKFHLRPPPSSNPFRSQTDSLARNATTIASFPSLSLRISIYFSTAFSSPFDSSDILSPLTFDVVSKR